MSTLSASAGAATVPTIHDVYTAASTGQLQQAKSEIDQVLAAYPNSAKAHYVDARVLALQGQWSGASAELANAQRLDPGLAFEKRDSLVAFQRQLAAHGGQPVASGHGFPWLGLIGAVLGLMAVLMIIGAYRRSRQPVVQVMPQAGWPANGQPPAGGFPGAGYPGYPAGPQPGGGSGFLGAVGTGLGVGAGIAAGEMLVDRMFGNHPQQPSGGGFIGNADAAPMPNDQDFGIGDAGGGWGDDGGSGDSWS